MNKIIANATFEQTKDLNLDFMGLKATIHYSVPSVFGFVKSKKVVKTIIEDTTPSLFLREAERLVVTGEIKKVIREVVTEDIMKRFVAHYEGEGDKINNLLNALNQMKFDFALDMKETEKTAIETNKVAFSKTKTNATLPRTFQYNQTTGNELDDLFD